MTGYRLYMSTQQSFFDLLPRQRTTNSSQFSRFTVIIAKSSFIPSTIQWPEFIEFFAHHPDLVFAAMERVPHDYTIVAGYDTPDDVPKHATDLLIFLVEHGIHPQIFTTDVSSIELSRSIRDNWSISLDKYFPGETIAREPTPPPMPDVELSPEQDTEQPFDQWWSSLDRDWHIPPSEHSIRIDQLDGSLTLFQNPQVDEYYSEIRKRKIQISNMLLHVPIVAPEIIADLGTHRSLFADETEMKEQEY
jgi:hypothetical protein